jgi:FSR family fosmidomycin resistance protein-like MFS transporter
MSADTQHKTRALWLVGTLHAFTHIYHVALLPLYLLMQRDFGFSQRRAGHGFGDGLMVTYYLPSYYLGVLADRLSRKRLLAWGLFINALGFVGLALAPNFGWALVAVMVAGVGGSFYHPAATAMIVRMFPNNAGRALGLIAIGASVGYFLGPIYAGWRAGALEAVVGAAAWRRPVLEFGFTRNCGGGAVRVAGG